VLGVFGFFVDHEDKDGMTPLLVAAFEGHRYLVI
jgi:ankyrin repeat protein